MLAHRAGVAKSRPALARGFGEIVRERRLAALLMQEVLAARCDVHPTYISLLERGSSSPSLAVIAVLAEELDTTAGALVTAAESRAG